MSGITGQHCFKSAALMTYQPAVPNTPPYDAPSIAFGAYLEREDLGRVEPRHCEPSRAEDEGEQNDERCSCSAILISLYVVVLCSGLLS